MKIIKQMPLPLYAQCYAHLPILCVESVVTDGKGNFLLIKRKHRPAREQWWFPGGRVFKFETIHRAVLRSLKQETGVQGKVVKLLGINEGIYPEGHLPGIACHTPTLVHLVKTNKKSRVKLDPTSSYYRWFKAIDPRWNAHVKKYLALSLQ